MDNVKEKDDRILIAKGLCTASHEAFCASFEIQASRTHTVGEKMLNIALVFSEKDSHRTKSDELMTAFALDYLKRMGWDKTQLIIIRHDDHDYDHIHMALNIIGDDGKPLDIKFYKTRSQRICYKMTKEYGLYFAKGKKNVNRSALKGKDKLKYQVADAAIPMLAAFEAYQMATQRNTDAINKFNHNSDVIKKQYKNISDLLCELLGRANLFPYEKPKFKDEGDIYC